MITAQLLEPGHRSKVYAATRKISSFRRSAQKQIWQCDEWYEMYIYSTNCTHICGKSTQKRQYVWWCMTNFHKFCPTHFHHCTTKHKNWPLFSPPLDWWSWPLQAWTREGARNHRASCCNDGGPLLMGWISFTCRGSLCIFQWWWISPKMYFCFFLRSSMKWGYAEDSWEMSKFQDKYINYMTPTLWGKQLYKIYITWSNPYTIPDLGLTPRCIFHMGPQKPDGRSTAEKRGQMGLLSW